MRHTFGLGFRRACLFCVLPIASCSEAEPSDPVPQGGAAGAAAGRAGTAGAGAGSGGTGLGGAGGTSVGKAGGAGSGGSAGGLSVGGGGASGGHANAAGAGMAGAGGAGLSGSSGSTNGGNAGAAGANAGSAGSAGAAPSGGAAGTSGAGTSGSGGTAPRGCQDPSIPICEDFEASEVGQLPPDWTKNGTVGVATDEFHAGTRSLKVEAAASGPRRMTLTGARVTALGGTHWGRVFYKVDQPAPRPASGVIHSTIVAGSAQSPISGTIEVRVVDTVEDAQGNHQYLYNVQPNERGEFGRGSSYDYQYDGEWHCAEWFVEHATQSYRFFIDGDEIESIAVANGAGNFAESEIPAVFQSISVGWYNYQSAPNGGFVAWLDDLAIGGSRFGCE
jgi:hypothetical protein